MMQINDNISFGELVSRFRYSLGLTQEEFGNILLITRTTIIKIEKSIDADELSFDLLFRLFYYAFRVIQTENIDEISKSNAIVVYNLIDITFNNTIGKKIDESLEISRRY